MLEAIGFAFDPEPAEAHGAVDRWFAPARRTDQRVQRQGRYVGSPLPAPGKRIADEAQERAPQCPVWDLGRVGLEAGAHVVRQLLERGCGDFPELVRRRRRGLGRGGVAQQLGAACVGSRAVGSPAA